MGNVSNLAYPALLPFLWSWYSWERHIESFPLFGPGAVTTIIGLDAKLAPRDVMERYHSKADNNFVNYSNEDYDIVLEQAIRTTDDEEKVTLYKEIQEILAEDAASIYIQDPALLVAVNPELAGYTFYPIYVQDMSKVYYTE